MKRLWIVLLLCGNARAIQHALILEPVQELLNITEVFRLENPDNATVQFHVPEPGMASVHATVQAPTGVTAKLPLQKTGEPGVFKLSFPAKPGITTFEIRYSLPMVGKFSGRTFGSAALRLVSGADVTLSGKAVRFVSREPRSQMNVYELVGVSSGEPFEVDIDANEDVSEQRQPRRGPAKIVERLPLLLALTCVLLFIGGTRLYRGGA